MHWPDQAFAASNQQTDHGVERRKELPKVQTKATDNAKIKLNDCILHKAAQIYRTCNWKEMQNERGLALFGHTRFP